MKTGFARWWSVLGRHPRRTMLAGLATLALLHTVAWLVAVDRVRSGVDRWVEDERSEGRTVTFGRSGRTGWPFAAGVALTRPTLTSSGFDWDAERLDVLWRPWAPSRILVRPIGQQTVVTGPVQVDMKASAFDVTFGLPAGDDVAFDVDDLAVGRAASTLSVGRLQGMIVAGLGGSASEPAASFHIVATGLHLPPGPGYLLGPDLASLTTEGMLSGPVPPPGPITRRAAVWRDGGGTARFDRVSLAWGRVTLDGNGRASLDRSLQPEAEFTVHLAGADEALDAMVSQGRLSARAATVARAVFGLYARATPANPGAPAPLPVQLKGGSLSLGGFPVASVPAIAWP